ISLPLWWLFQPVAGMQFTARLPWIPAWGISYTVGVDGISLFLVLLTTVLVPLSVLGSYTYITKRERGFYANLLVLTTGVIGVFPAFAIKVPMFPFHTWLPDAHVEAPTAGSVILAGVLLKMGTYGFLRFTLPFFPQIALHPAVQTAIVVLSLIGIIYGGLVAM